MKPRTCPFAGPLGRGGVKGHGLGVSAHFDVEDTGPRNLEDITVVEDDCRATNFVGIPKEAV